MDIPDPESTNKNQGLQGKASTADGLKLIKAFIKIESQADRDKVIEFAERLIEGTVNVDNDRTERQ
jgi:hypothetical protein